MESLNVTTAMNELLNNSSGNSTTDSIPPAHCTRGSLTSSYGWMIQGILAGLAFTSLISKCK